MRAVFAGSLILAGCAAVGPSAQPSRDFLAVTAGRVAGETRTCIPNIGRSGLSAVDSRTLSYDGGSVLWLNRLPQDCPGLRPLSTLIVETIGTQYCRGDRFRANEPGSIIPGPSCVLSDFTAYRKVK
jgi:hypothetical protein